MTRPEPPGQQHCADDVCITCSDAAVAVRVTALLEDDLAMVRTEAGTEEEISVALVAAHVGDTVLVHAKEAIARLVDRADNPDEVDAHEVHVVEVDR
jgi:hydrogenase expression/formation protein HypC